MNMPKSTPESIEFFAGVVPDTPDVEQKKMFGCLACFVNGNMFMGLYGDGIFVRLGIERREELLRQGAAELFEPMPGRPMRDYVVVHDSLKSDAAKTQQFVDESLAHVRTLPHKEKKPRADKSAGRKVRKPEG